MFDLARAESDGESSEEHDDEASDEDEIDDDFDYGYETGVSQPTHFDIGQLKKYGPRHRYANLTKLLT